MEQESLNDHGMNTPLIPNHTPCCKEIDRYQKTWNTLDSYVHQERALDKLFFDLCKSNENIEDILIKCAALNDFYSTHIFDIHSVAQHILDLHIDNDLEKGDLSLVEKIAKIKVGESKSERCFYSFASKYCSHHKPLEYAIYDNYVASVLIFFKQRDKFADFKNKDLKNYEKYIEIIKAFQVYYKIEKYNLKEIDRYLWQLGKEYFSR